MVSFLASFLLPVLPVSAQTNDWKSDNVVLLLHRAASMAAPENTVPALESAVKQGADGVEIDVRQTRDGYLVLYHDDWVLEDRGPGGKIEEMPLADVLALDVGKRFGPQWRGLRTPLFHDVLRFARANNLLLFLDIKTDGIYSTVMRVVQEAGCLSLVRNVGGKVPKDVYRSPDTKPFIQGWNYTDGGEEDPLRIASAKTRIPPDGCQIMADDARAWAHVLNRRPERRSFTPFMVLPYPVQPKIRTEPRLPDATDVLVARAEAEGATANRLAALWELGTRRDASAIRRLEALARRPYPAKDGPEHFEKFFLKIGAACALARYESPEARVALRRLAASAGKYDRASAAFALAAFGTRADLPLMTELVTPDARNNAIVRDVILGYAGRFGIDALPIYEAALPVDGFAAKLTIFGLANRGKAVEPFLRKRLADKTTLPLVRHRLELVRSLIQPMRT